MKALVEFFAARLAEDEKVALDWQNARLILTEQYQNNPTRNHVRAFRERVTDTQRAEYQYGDRFNPDRVLRDVAADRKLIARYVAATETHEESIQALRKLSREGAAPADVQAAHEDRAAAHGRASALLAVMEDRAARFADHDDYKPEWPPGIDRPA